MNNVIVERLNNLRKCMSDENITWYYMTSSDFHESEYVADYFKLIEYYSNFTGENAFLVVNRENAYLWTDGRFFIQANNELLGTGIELMKMGEKDVPTVLEFFKDNIKENETLCFDGRTVSYTSGKQIRDIVSGNKAKIVENRDFAGELWANRPSMPCTKAFLLSESQTGENVKSKLERIRGEIKKAGCNCHFLSKIDDIMWITNIRANDIECNPVALSYLFITLDKAYLFIQEAELSEEVSDYLKNNNIEVLNYAFIIDFLKEYNYTGKVLLDESTVNFSAYNTIKENAVIENVFNPSTLFKAIKNNIEIENLKEAYLLDSVCVTKFIYWLKTEIKNNVITEISAADYLDSLRSCVPGFIELSFPTISGYGSNGAIVHYGVTEESNATLKPEGMILVDSGATYEKGTTDVTRTISLGKVSDKMRLYYTKTAVSMLTLANQRFLHGCTGRNLDIIARMNLWNIGYDYKHGTGHGVGHILNVHEGPQSIRWQYIEGRKEWILEPGMVTSDEPGVYFENEFGIRIENIVLCEEDIKNESGDFLKFTHLTWAPLDRALLDKNVVSDVELKLINDYQENVYNLMKSHLSKEEDEWLFAETRPL